MVGQPLVVRGGFPRFWRGATQVIAEVVLFAKSPD